jgi:hypothetical protein
MAKQMSVMMFGKYKGQPVDEVPTSYLLWVYGSFPKLRNKLQGILEARGLSRNEIRKRSGRHKVLGRVPESNEKRRKQQMKPRKIRRTDDQKRANNVARAIGHDIPFPQYQQPLELQYFTRKGGA